MVTPTVDDLSDEFEAIVEDQDIMSAAAIGLSGAGGGALSNQVSTTIMDLVGMETPATGIQGLFASGAIKMVFGAALGYAAIEVGGTAGVLLGIAGLGALIVGGGDWINAILDSTPTAGAPVNRGNSRAATSVTVSNPSNYQAASEWEEGQDTAVQELLG